MKTFHQKHSLPLAWIQAVLALVGSLFFSLVMELPPCDLCWYQRICIYPLIIIIGVGIIRKDRNFLYYALPLAVIGWFFALYHNLLYYHIIPESFAPCRLGVSCTTHYYEWFGFVSIPLLSFVSFSFILFCLLGYRKHSK